MLRKELQKEKAENEALRTENKTLTEENTKLKKFCNVLENSCNRHIAELVVVRKQMAGQAISPLQRRDLHNSKSQVILTKPVKQKDHTQKRKCKENKKTHKIKGCCKEAMRKVTVTSVPYGVTYYQA